MRAHELNLVMIFDAIMAESSITKAAARLNLTQPAVSNAVARMRHVWKDDLFVKNGRNIRPTVRAQNLWESIRNPLNEIADALEKDVFDPTTSVRNFRVGAIDSMAGLAWAQLRCKIEKEASNISLHTFPYTITNGEQMLNDAEVDLLIAPSDLMPPVTTSRYLFDIEFACVMKPKHKLATGKFTLDKFVKADHLLASLSGDVSGYADRALAEKRKRLKIAMSVNGFANVSDILQQTNLICVLPSIYIEQDLRAGRVIARKLPIPIPNTPISVFWHKRSERDPGIHWLEQQISDLIKKRALKHQEVLTQIRFL